MLGRRCLYEQLLIQILGSRVSLADNISHKLSQFNTGGIKHILCDSTGENFWKLVPGFLWISPHALFPLVDIALRCFAVIHHSHEYDCMLSPVSRSTKSLNLRVFLWTLNTEGNQRTCEQTLCSYFFLYRICQFGTQIWVEGPGREFLLRIREANKL